MRCSMTSGRGFTLMELLVVLLIIGVLSTVAIRTIDATRDRALFDQTAEEMKELAEAVVGNPELLTDGRRVDFGFYGDVGRMPNDLRELVESSDPNWRGPYIRRGLAGDSVGYLHDAWGDPYTYDMIGGVISSTGNGKYPMTTPIIENTAHLRGNTVSGSVVDSDLNPPGDASVAVDLYIRPGEHKYTSVDRGGKYEFTEVPIGTHRIKAYSMTTLDSVVRWVTVAPRTDVVLDFRMTRPLRNFLRMVGRPRLIPLDPDSSNGFEFDVVNVNIADVTVDSVTILVIDPDTAYFRDMLVGSKEMRGFPVPLGDSGFGENDTAPLYYLDDGSPVTIEANMGRTVPFAFLKFYYDHFGAGEIYRVHDKKFILRFNDGSEITVEP
ncbi:MAG: carboxypeptidase regulatory-like domain-containing protein [candidate division WOR-3 bacterium]|nr:MAG: carboxypeptidase regulatory-like domain-containing protein [candidate division WOR-3 bacterium]